MNEITPLHERLKQLKEKSHMTVHQISIKTAVPESTLSRIFSGETDRPSFHVISQIVSAMGGSLDVLAGLKESRDIFIEEHLREELKRTKDELEKEKARNATLEKWLSRLFTMLCIVVGAVILINILDALDGSWGRWQY